MNAKILVKTTLLFVVSLMYVLWGKTVLSAVDVGILSSGNPVSVDAYVQTSVTYEAMIFMDCNAGGFWNDLTATPTIEGSFLISYLGTWGDPVNPPVPSSRWPVRITTYQTPTLKCDGSMILPDVGVEHTVRHDTLVVPDFPSEYREGYKFYITACLEKAIGNDTIPYRFSPECAPPLAVEVYEPLRPDLVLYGGLTPINETCGFQMETRVENKGKAAAKGVNVTILRSYNGVWEDGDDQQLYQSERQSIEIDKFGMFSHVIPGPINYTGCESVGARRVCDKLHFRICASRGMVDSEPGGGIRNEKKLLDNCQTYHFRTPIWSSDHYKTCEQNAHSSAVPLVTNIDHAVTTIPGMNPDNFAPHIFVTKPAADERICIGQTSHVKWTTIGEMSPGVEISLLKDGATVMYLPDGVDGAIVKNLGDISWTTPSMMVPGTYSIKVSTKQEPLVTGVSRPFTIERCD